MPRASFTPNLQRHIACSPADVAGETVGSSTGSLWTSKDQGAGWTVISERLPPVCVARWA